MVGRGGGDRKIYYVTQAPQNSGAATAPIETITTNTTEERSTAKVDAGSSVSACLGRALSDSNSSLTQQHKLHHSALNRAWYCSSLTFSIHSTTLPSFFS